MVLGLKYIAQTYKKSLTQIAKEMGISRQTINDWLSERRLIPEARIEDLSRMFPSVPRIYFQKELTKSEMLHVHELYLRHTDYLGKMEVSFYDNESNEYITTEVTSENEFGIRMLSDKRQRFEAYEKFSKVLKQMYEKDADTMDTKENLIYNFILLYDTGDNKKLQLLETLLRHINHLDFGENQNIAFGKIYDELSVRVEELIEFWKSHNK